MSSSRTRALLALFLTVCLCPHPASAQLDNATAAKVNDAVAKAKAYLYAQQTPDGTWEDVAGPVPPGQSKAQNDDQDPDAGQWGGRTSLALYALLAAGESPTEPRLAKAVAFVKTSKISGTYAVGVRMLALSYLPMKPDVKAAVGAEAQLLLQTVKTQKDAAGHYDYNVLYRDAPLVYSHSRSQYGTLGMWAADRMGYDAPPAYWQLVDAGWRRNQRAGGGWGYKVAGGESDTKETLGMTVAGVASLFITNDMLGRANARACNGNLVDANIEAGLKWIAEHFEDFDPDSEYLRDWKYPTLYGLERVGAASGLRSIGGNDWYARGVAWLLPEQKADGSFKSAGKSGRPETAGLVDTCFALLFLGRGRSPVLAAKLVHGDARGAAKADWNQRPRDLANLAAFAGSGIERELHWQIVTADRSADEWLDAPMLYLSGSDALDLPADVKDKLRDYARKGGLIVLNADCGRAGFARSAQQLGKELFPGYDFRVLETDSPIYSMQYPLAKARRVPRAMALGNGARELMVLIDQGDAGRDWQTSDAKADAEALQFGANLYLYAVDRGGQRYKGQTTVVAPNPAKKPSRKAAVGRIKYAGNWNPEPYGWDRLAAVMHNDYGTDLSVRAVDPSTDDLAGLQLLHLTGTDAFALTDLARKAIAAFVDSGGTLLVDAAGGSSAFGTAADKELREIFGNAADALTQPAPPDLSLYGDLADAPKLAVEYRLAARQSLGDAREPMLRVINKGERPAVIYSAQDLSVGLVGMPVAGVVGYAPETATALVARAVRLASEK